MSVPTTDQLNRMSRGFLCIAWGLFLGLLLFGGVLRIVPMHVERSPQYLVGIVLAYVGCIQLFLSQWNERAWSRVVRHMLYTLLLMVYLSPFAYWWQAVPHHGYFFLHVAALGAGLLMFLYLTLRASAVLGAALDQPVLRRIAVCASWLLVAGLALPLTVMLGVAATRTIVYDSSLLNEWIELSAAHAPALIWMFSIPFALTLFCAGWGHRLCRRHILRRARNASRSAPLTPTPSDRTTP